MDLSAEVVLVTGGAQGIGRAIVRAALDAGARVSFCDLDADAGAAYAAELATERVRFAAADVTDEGAVGAWAAAAREAFGPATGLVNNAGRNAYFDPVELTTAQWDDFFALDLRAAWTCARAVLPGMRAAAHGSIVNVSSIHAQLTTAGMFPYAAAKAGLIGLTRSLALEEAPHGVRVNAIRPGLVWTPLAERHFADSPDELAVALAAQPSGRAARPEEIAAVVCFLLSPSASYVNGADWAVDGAYGVRFA